MKQGKNAMTITLPAQWVKEQGLKEGDYVLSEIQEKGLLIRTGHHKATPSTKTISTKTQDKTELYHLINSAYIEGHSQIIIHHQAPRLVQEAVSSLIGMVIEEHHATTTIINDIIVEPTDNLETLTNRTLRQLKEHFDLIKQHSSDKNYPQIKSHERIIDHTILYCMRFINRYEKGPDSYRRFLFYATIESVVDQLSYLAKFLPEDSNDLSFLEEVITTYVNGFLTNQTIPLIAKLKTYKQERPKKSFVDALIFNIIETLSNNIGYLAPDDISRK